MSKPTPGPWRIGKCGAIVADCPQPHEDPSGHESFYGGHFVCESVTGPDAVLIAAAPDLLAALESAPKVGQYEGRSADFTCDYSAWYDGPRAAALAKVKP